LLIKHVTSNQEQIDLDMQISKVKEKIEKLIITTKITKQRNSLEQIIDYVTNIFEY